MRKQLIIAAIGLFVVTAAHRAGAHCQVPCGIYDDEARIEAMREDVTTIGKAVDHIVKLSGEHDPLSFNQTVRWVQTKEDHASRIIDTVAVYFLTQKLKPPKGDSAEELNQYYLALADHHALMRAAMVTKQTTDPQAVEKLKLALEAVAKHWVMQSSQTQPHNH